MLYVPARFAHWGVSMDDECMTYSIGFRAPNLQVSSPTTCPVPLPLAFLLPSLAIKSCVLAAHSDGRAASGGTLAQEPPHVTRLRGSHRISLAFNRGPYAYIQSDTNF